MGWQPLTIDFKIMCSCVLSSDRGIIFSPVNMSFEPRSDIAPRIISIEKQLATIRSMQPQSSIHKDGKLDEDTLEGMIRENSINLQMSLPLLLMLQHIRLYSLLTLQMMKKWRLKRKTVLKWKKIFHFLLLKVSSP